MKNLEDLLYPLLNSYKNSPQIIKNIIGGFYALLPESLIYGNVYNQFCNIISSGKSFTRHEILAYQWKEIEKVLDVAFSSIPFYKSLYNTYGIKRNQIQNISDLNNLPIINKQSIRKNGGLLLSEKYGKHKLKMNTGGSTGIPMEFYIHKGITRPKERAFLNSFYHSLGYDRSQKAATFRGDKVQGDRLYMYDPIKNNFIFSSYRINDKTINEIVHNLSNIQPKYIFGYPSVIYDAARLIKNNSRDKLTTNIRGIILASEKLFRSQIELIEEIFSTRVFSFYGHSERLVLGYKCFQCSNHLMDPLYGYAQIVDHEGKEIIKKGEVGRVIATGFHNLVMPLIRYDTNDESSYAEHTCKGCENHSTAVYGDIEGRASDYIVGNDGRKISITAIIFGQHLSEFKKIPKFQLVQHEPGKVEFNIDGSGNLTIQDEQSLKKKIEMAADHTITVQIVYVNEFILSSSGKFNYLVQNIIN